MHDAEINLANWKTALMASIPLGGLFSRSATAYKWKAPFRCWMLHESVLWRLHDLLTQSVALHKQGHGLGARTLLRSGFETLATLIYLNQLMKQVLDGTLGFHEFDEKTLRLTVGSKNKSTKTESINIITILGKCEKRYQGLRKSKPICRKARTPAMRGYALDIRRSITTFTIRTSPTDGWSCTAIIIWGWSSCVWCRSRKNITTSGVI